jgi:uncharacterized protein
MDTLAIAATNLLSPMVLFFALGFAAALVRSDLVVPEAIAKGMALYLMLAIGFKGGAGLAEAGFEIRLAAVLLAGILLSLLIPLVAFALLTVATNLPRVDAAAVAAHYGSISIVTFVAATEMLRMFAVPFDGFMVATAAVMEAPAIAVALWLAGRNGASPDQDPVWREVMFNGSVVVLIGAFAIGWITGERGLAEISAFIVDPFKGILCLFLLDMGLIAARGLRQGAHAIGMRLVAFALAMPLLGAAMGAAAGLLVGLDAGSTAILMTLAASSSYIAVPAAMRLALPEARPEIYLTLSLCITFPFNLTVGIPLYLATAQWFA